MGKLGKVSSLWGDGCFILTVDLGAGDMRNSFLTKYSLFLCWLGGATTAYANNVCSF